uniref:Shugoshin_C domain-containing protein n=1 Tax=Mesocestoides corti TaxID=53468 RepID=A0A5K3FVR6_MESCO
MKGKKALRDLFAGAKECSTLRLSSFEKLNESQIAAHLSESLICHASDLGDSVVHDSSPAAGADHLNVGKRIRTTTKVSRRGTSSRTQGKARNRLRCRRMLIENTGAVNVSSFQIQH